MNVRETAAKRLSAANAYTNSKNQVLVLNLDIERIVADYQQKIAKLSQKSKPLYQSIRGRSSCSQVEKSTGELPPVLRYVMSLLRSRDTSTKRKNGIGETFKEGRIVVDHAHGLHRSG